VTETGLMSPFSAARLPCRDVSVHEAIFVL